MGLVGAGLATVISQFLSMGYLLLYYLNGDSYLKMRVKNLALDFKILKDMLSIGIAAFTQSITNSLSIMILINLVVTYGGDLALSAFGIAQRLMFFAIPITTEDDQYGRGMVHLNKFRSFSRTIFCAGAANQDIYR
jgi:Na+-driven multidrug efflux pump